MRTLMPFPPAAVVVLLVAACFDSGPEAPDPPVNPPAGAVFLGAVQTTAGVGVVGATGQIHVYRESAEGDLDYVGGQRLTTDGMGEFVETVVLADVGTFEASVRIVIVPPPGLALRPDTANGTVLFTPSVTDTLRVSITLEET